MNRRRQKTLEALFVDPPSGTIAWASIEALLRAVGCETVEGRGSRVRFVKDGLVEAFHRPHPAKARKYQVRAARDYLTRLGVKP